MGVGVGVVLPDEIWLPSSLKGFICQSGMTNSQVSIQTAFDLRPSQFTHVIPTTRGVVVSWSSSYSSAHPPKMDVVQCSPHISCISHTWTFFFCFRLIVARHYQHMIEKSGCRAFLQSCSPLIRIYFPVYRDVGSIGLRSRNRIVSSEEIKYHRHYSIDVAVEGDMVVGLELTSNLKRDGQGRYNHLENGRNLESH
jgi:hypothetical protein